MHRLVLATCLLLAPAVPAAEPAARVAAFETWEAAVPVRLEAANPFDPDEVAVVGVFEYASGGTLRVPGFWLQDYAYELDGEDRAERLTPRGEAGFRVRFAPARPGECTYHFEVMRRGRTQTIPGGRLVVTEPRGSGPLRRKAGGRYFVTASGEPVFLIGQNVAWSSDPAPLDDLLRYVREMAESGQNVLRLWHCTWCLGFEHEATGRYDLERAWKLDRLLEEAERRGVYVVLCLENAHDMRAKKSPYWKGLGRGAKGIASPAEFYTSPAARRAFRNRLRYALARWGHSTALGAWELINEMEYVVLGPLELDSTVRDRYFRPWLDEMAAFVRQTDVHGHLLTCSLAVDRLWDDLLRMPWLDLVQHHAYLNAWDADGAGKVLRNLSHINGFRKPYLLGEFGGAEAGVYGAKENTVNRKDERGIHLHNALWASALSGAGGTPLMWWWDSYVRPRRLYGHFAALRAFLRDTPWLDPRLRAEDLSTADARVLVLRGEAWARVWAQNRRYTWELGDRRPEPVGPLAVRLDAMPPGTYRVEWWDTLKGQVLRTEDLACQGTLQLTIRELATDVALKIRRRSP